MKANVAFDSAGLKIARHLYTPADGATGPRPAIVVGSLTPSASSASSGGRCS